METNSTHENYATVVTEIRLNATDYIVYIALRWFTVLQALDGVRMSRVVLLGAGASAGSKYHLPVMAGFIDKNAGESFPVMMDFICNHCFGGSAIWHEPNLEDVMTHLQVLESGFLPADSDVRHPVTKVHKELDAYVFKRLVADPLGSYEGTDYVPRFECSLHRRLFALLGESDSILTLNYDLVADGTLYAIAGKDGNGILRNDSLLSRSLRLNGRAQGWDGDRATLRRSELGLGYYLKLHGSVDWYCCPNRECAYHGVFFSNMPSAADVHVIAGDPCFLCGTGLVRAMIPPSLGKALDEFPKTRLLWKLAFRKLCEARTWIIVGVSLAPSDYYLKTLLREAAARVEFLDLVVINPSTEHRKRMEECVKPNTVVCKDSLAEWLDEISTM